MNIEKLVENKIPQIQTELQKNNTSIPLQPRVSENLDVLVDKMYLSDEAEEDSPDSEDPRLMK